MATGIEWRNAAEFRSAAPGRLVGYAAVYGAWSRDLGGFVERVAPGAFDVSLREPDRILALWDHDGRHVLGRVGARTLRLASDTKGLHFEIDLPPTTAGRDLGALVERGDVAGASFAFQVRPNGDTWEHIGSVARRVLRDLDLREITVTADPAYPDTTVAKAALGELRPVARSCPALLGDVPMRWPWQRKEEKRSVLGWENLVPYPVASGQAVTVSRVEGIAVAQVCITLIAETCASLPLKVYRRDDDGRQEAPDHPLARVLRQPNGWQTAMEWREQMVAAMLTAGNAYSQIALDGRGAVAALVPLQPEAVNPVRLVNGSIAYDLTTPRGRERLLADEVLHFRWRSKDGVRGLSPIQIARETFGNALAETEYQGAMWRNGARPSAVLQHPGRLGADALARLRASFEDKFSGTSNSGKVLIVEEGMTLEPWSLSAKDAEFIAARKLTAEDVCRVFNVPPPVAHLLDNATYSNISEQLKSFVRLTIRPWLVRIEQTITDKLLSEAGRRQFFVEHSVEGLLRADTKDRFEAYRIGREWGWLSPNDIRRLENMPPIPNGDIHTSPLNMAPLGSRGEASA